jgi:hypothetical protein
MFAQSLTRLTGVLALGFLIACQPTASSEESSPEERIKQRWAYLIEQDFAAAWEMHSPGFRETTPMPVFLLEMARRPIQVLDARLVDLACEEDVCDARIELTYRVLQGPTGIPSMRIPSEIEERWILDGGEWWYLRG